jgi:hypothetical protein
MVSPSCRSQSETRVPNLDMVSREMAYRYPEASRTLFLGLGCRSGPRRRVGCDRRRPSAIPRRALHETHRVSLGVAEPSHNEPPVSGNSVTGSTTEAPSSCARANEVTGSSTST